MRYVEITEGVRSSFKVGDTVVDSTEENSPRYTITDTDDWDYARLESEDGEEVEIPYAYLKAATPLQQLDERRYGNRGWVILPATMSLYNRRTVDIITAASTWDSSTIYVCTKAGESRLLFVASSGRFNGCPVGSSHEVYHDQTQAFKGVYTIVNIVEIKDGEIVAKENEIGLNAKASLSVFK